jgi:hypothetical protein
MKSEMKKSAILLICASGVFAVAYGMLKGNNIAFIIGLIFVIAGYLFIRKKLKDSASNIKLIIP